MANELLVVNQKKRLTKVVERSLPAHVLVLVSDQLRRQGLEFRPDFEEGLNQAAILPLQDLPPEEVSRTARTIDETARQVLGASSFDDTRDLLYATSVFIVTLVEEGLFSDTGNQAVLASALALEDVRDDDAPEVQGGISYRPRKERAWQEGANRMLTRARLSGYYHALNCS